MGGVKGDFEGLRDLKRRIAGVEKPNFRRQLVKGLAEEARTQVHVGFQRAEDPEGVAWKPLRSRDGQPLRDTGRLLNSIAVHAFPSGFTLSTQVKYAATHQYGATIRAKNPTLSFGGAGSDGQDTVTAGKPMLRFRVGGARPRKNGKWVSKAEVTIPRRRFIPEGNIGTRWVRSLEDEAERIMQVQMGVET